MAKCQLHFPAQSVVGRSLLVVPHSLFVATNNLQRTTIGILRVSFAFVPVRGDEAVRRRRIRFHAQRLRELLPVHCQNEAIGAGSNSPAAGSGTAPAKPSSLTARSAP